MVGKITTRSNLFFSFGAALLFARLVGIFAGYVTDIVKDAEAGDYLSSISLWYEARCSLAIFELWGDQAQFMKSRFETTRDELEEIITLDHDGFIRNSK